MEQWTPAENYFETGNCETACPCVSSARQRRVSGRSSSRGISTPAALVLPLDGLNSRRSGLARPNDAGEVERGALPNSRATPEQRDALMSNFSGQAGGDPAVLASIVGQLLGVKSAAIDYQNIRQETQHQNSGTAVAKIEALEPIDAPTRPSTITRSPSRRDIRQWSLGVDRAEAIMILVERGNCRARTATTPPLRTRVPEALASAGKGHLPMGASSAKDTEASWHREIPAKWRVIARSAASPMSSRV